jgi:hypothetical protein
MAKQLEFLKIVPVLLPLFCYKRRLNAQNNQPGTRDSENNSRSN